MFTDGIETDWLPNYVNPQKPGNYLFLKCKTHTHTHTHTHMKEAAIHHQTITHWLECNAHQNISVLKTCPETDETEKLSKMQELKDVQNVISTSTNMWKTLIL